MPAPADATWNRDAPFALCLSQFLTVGLMRNDQRVPVFSYQILA